MNKDILLLLRLNRFSWLQGSVSLFLFSFLVKLQLKISLDKFGNVCPLSVQDVHSYCVEITEIGSSEKTDPELVILLDGFDKNNVLHIKLDDEGGFNAVVKYNGITLNQGKLTVISLNHHTPMDAIRCFTLDRSLCFGSCSSPVLSSAIQRTLRLVV